MNVLISNPQNWVLQLYLTDFLIPVDVVGLSVHFTSIVENAALKDYVVNVLNFKIVLFEDTPPSFNLPNVFSIVILTLLCRKLNLLRAAFSSAQ